MTESSWVMRIRITRSTV